MNHYYYPRNFKNIIVALSDMFNDMSVYKYDAGSTSAGYGTSSQEIPVKFTFGPVEKESLQRREDHEYIASATDANGYTQVEAHGKRYYLYLPRMALVMNGIAYNAERAYGVNEWREWFQEVVEISGANIDEVLRDYQPAPWDINFTLYIMTDSMDYFSQIMENILPYFNPSLYLRVKEFSFLNIERNLKVTTDGVVPEFISPEISDDERRYVNGTMNITVEAYMYRPFENMEIIKSIHSKYFVVDTNVTSATSAFGYESEPSTTPPAQYLISADYFDTSGAILTSAGISAVPLSAIPESYTFSGTYETDSKDYIYFTSATNNITSANN